MYVGVFTVVTTPSGLALIESLGVVLQLITVTVIRFDAHNEGTSCGLWLHTVYGIV